MPENKFNISKGLSDFFDTISKNKEEVEKLFSFPSIEEMYKYALSKSEDKFSEKEFNDALNLMIKCLKSSESNEISDDELRSVAGGTDDKETTLRSLAIMVPSIGSLLETLLNLGYKLKSDSYNRKISKENKFIDDLEKKKKEYELRIQIENYKKELELKQKNN